MHNEYNYRESKCSLYRCPILGKRNKAQNTQKILTSRGHTHKTVQHDTSRPNSPTIPPNHASGALSNQGPWYAIRRVTLRHGSKRMRTGGAKRHFGVGERLWTASIADLELEISLERVFGMTLLV